MAFLSLEETKPEILVSFLYPDSKYKNIVFVSTIKDGIRKDISKPLLNELITFYSDLKINNNLDYYITSNSFKTGKTSARDNLSSIFNITVDCDFHDLQYDELNLIFAKAELEDLIYSKLPQKIRPNVILDTGCGLHLKWNFEEVPYEPFSETYDLILFELIKIIKELIVNCGNELINKYIKIDKITPEKLVRLPGTYNTRNKSKVEGYLINENRYTIIDLFNILQLKRPKNQVAGKKPQAKIIDDNYKILNIKRQRFLTWLINNQNCVGRRNNIIFLCANSCYFLYGDTDESRKIVFWFNKQFKKPLPEKEINKMFTMINSVGGYRFKNQNWFDFINLTNDEIRAFNNIKVLPQNYKRDKEKIERRNNDMKNREKRINIANDLRKQGCSVLDIANILNVSKSTVEDYLKTAETTYEDIKQIRFNKIKEMQKEGKTMPDIAAALGISKETCYRLLRQYKEV